MRSLSDALIQDTIRTLGTPRFILRYGCKIVVYARLPGAFEMGISMQGMDMHWTGGPVSVGCYR
jgi:hypothetical protein